MAMRSTMPRADMLQRATQSMKSRKWSASGGGSSRASMDLRFEAPWGAGRSAEDDADRHARAKRRRDESAGFQRHPARDGVGEGLVQRDRHQHVGDRSGFA